MLRINLGCGEFKLEGFVNVDCEPGTKPDLLLDFTKERLPFKDGEIDEVYIIHCIEHIEYKKWNFVFSEIKRVLKPMGQLVLAYPEFKKCAEGFLLDTGNMKDFYRATLYGRQLYPSDYHVSPIHSPYLKQFLEEFSFFRIYYSVDPAQSFNTIMSAMKDPAPVMREDVLVKELHLEQARTPATDSATSK